MTQWAEADKKKDAHVFKTLDKVTDIRTPPNCKFKVGRYFIVAKTNMLDCIRVWVNMKPFITMNLLERDIVIHDYHNIYSINKYFKSLYGDGVHIHID